MSATPAPGRDLLGGGDNPPVRRYRERLMQRLALGPGKGRKALDLGCGDGLEAAWLASQGWKVEAYDLEAHPGWPALAKASRGRIRFAVIAADGLKRLRGRYDLVFQKDMLHHAADPVAILVQMRRLCAAAGRVVVLEVNRRNPISYLHLTLLRGHQHFTRARLGALLQQGGLDGYRLLLIEARVWPLPWAWAQRAADKLEDALEALPFWRPFITYHAAVWTGGRR